MINTCLSFPCCCPQLASREIEPTVSLCVSLLPSSHSQHLLHNLNIRPKRRKKIFHSPPALHSVARATVAILPCPFGLGYTSEAGHECGMTVGEGKQREREWLKDGEGHGPRHKDSQIISCLNNTIQIRPVNLGTAWFFINQIKLIFSDKGWVYHLKCSIFIQFRPTHLLHFYRWSLLTHKRRFSDVTQPCLNKMQSHGKTLIWIRKDLIKINKIRNMTLNVMSVDTSYTVVH